MQQRVKGPAIGLLVLGVINALIAAWGLVQNVIGATQKDEVIKQLTSAGMPEGSAAQLADIMTSLGVALPVVEAVAAAFVIWAATRMMKLSGWGAAVTASFLVMLPLVTPCVCCIPGLGIGIWSLVVLFNDEVKRAFTGQPPAL